jgi:tRNA (guanine-N7-)-methyltransferase
MPRSPLFLDTDSLEHLPASHWNNLFEFSGPLEVEIGSGKGDFAANYGAKHPYRRLVALEHRRTYAEMTYQQVSKLGLRNVRVFQADAKHAIPKLFLPSSLQRVHLYFPDPWWKRRHFKRRVIDVDFSKTLLNLLVPGGFLHIRTDVEERAHDMLRILSQAGFHNSCSTDFASFDPDNDVPTTRERRYLLHNEPVWRMNLYRPAD